MSPEKQEPDNEDGHLHECVQAVKAGPPPRGAYESARRNLLNKLAEKPEENIIVSTIKNFTRPGLRRWATVSGLTLLVLAAVLFLNPLGGNPSQAFATVAAQLRLAKIVSFTVTFAFDENQAPTPMQIAFCEPSLQRTEANWDGQRVVSILDTANNRGLILMPDLKVGNETEISSMPSVEHERIQMIRMLTQAVKNLPAEADAALGESTIDGRRLEGFRIGENVYWIDASLKHLVRLETQVGGRKMVVSDFRLDPPDLDVAMFSTRLPAGFTSMAPQAFKLDTANVGEQDLVAYLRLLGTVTVSREFPATINPLEILTLEKEKKIDIDHADMSLEQKMRFPQDYAHFGQRQAMFTLSLKKENDFHYAGKGVKLGDAKTIIAWWKPTGLANYRVIWGDLRITEEPPEVVRIGK